MKENKVIRDIVNLLFRKEVRHAQLAAMHQQKVNMMQMNLGMMSILLLLLIYLIWYFCNLDLFDDWSTCADLGCRHSQGNLPSSTHPWACLAWTSPTLLRWSPEANPASLPLVNKGHKVQAQALRRERNAVHPRLAVRQTAWELRMALDNAWVTVLAIPGPLLVRPPSLPSCFLFKFFITFLHCFC